MAPPAHSDTPLEGEKKRRTETMDAPITQAPLAARESANPPLATSTPSFLGENLDLYLASPSPNPGTSTPTRNSFNLESFLSSLAADTSVSSTLTTHSTPTSSLKDRLLAAKEHEKNETPNTPAARDPLEKYTKSDYNKCTIHFSHPTAAFNHIDIDQVEKWETLPDGKLLAHPFGLEVKSLINHPEIKTKIFEAVGEITQSNSVGVNAPKPVDQEPGTPLVFLIYNLSEIHRQMLLSRKVWSSSEITFRVTSMDPVRPDYLFSIKDLTIKAIGEVKAMVRKIWDNDNTANFLMIICQTCPENQRLLIAANLKEFTNSMWVEKLETKSLGNVDAPTFNIYAKGNYISDDETWHLLKNYLATQKYAPDFQDPGNAGTDFH
jgi:hypothetical protein